MTASIQAQALTVSNKKSPYEPSRHIYAAPKLLPQSASNSWSIDVWYRCNNGWEGIERTKIDNNRATKSTYLSAKIALRIDPPQLRRSKGIAVILIKFLIDWCIIHAMKLVRRNRKNKKGRCQRKSTYQHVNKKSPYESSRHSHAAPEILPPSSSNSRKIDV